MGFVKYQSVEKTQALSELEQKSIRTFLSKVGKTSVAEITEEERKSLLTRKA